MSYAAGCDRSVAGSHFFSLIQPLSEDQQKSLQWFNGLQLRTPTRGFCGPTRGCTTLSNLPSQYIYYQSCL